MALRDVELGGASRRADGPPAGLRTRQRAAFARIRLRWQGARYTSRKTENGYASVRSRTNGRCVRRRATQLGELQQMSGCA